MEKIKALKNHECLCWKCLESKNNIKVIKIPGLGYGSTFDEFYTEIHLCEDCYNDSNTDLWNLNIVSTTILGETFDEYENEDELWEYIDNLPIQGRQFVMNEFSDGAGACYTLEPQDWIDYKLGILPHDKCKEYGLYSCEEIKAYEERFPICEHPVNIVYKDGSVGCRCPYGAFGNKDQELSRNISEECYQCDFFKKRTSERKTVYDDFY